MSKQGVYHNSTVDSLPNFVNQCVKTLPKVVESAKRKMTKQQNQMMDKLEGADTVLA